MRRLAGHTDFADASDPAADVHNGQPPPLWRDPAVVGEPEWVRGLLAWQDIEGSVRPTAEPEVGADGWWVSPWSELAVPDDSGAPSPVLDSSSVTVPEWDRERLGEAAEPLALVPRLDGERPLPLEGTPTGSSLAVLLEMGDPRHVSDATLLELAAAAERMKAWAEAVGVAATQELVGRCAGLRGVGEGRDEVDPQVAAAAELGPVLGLSGGSARLRVGFAQALRRLPDTLAALRAGRIDWSQARTLVAATAGCDDTAARAVEERVLARPGRCSRAGWSAAVRRAVLAIDPAGAERRRQAARAERGVWRELVEDGLAELTWRAGAEDVERLYRRIDALARDAQAGDRDRAVAARAAGRDPEPVRTLDQARADVLTDLGRDGLAAVLEQLCHHPGEPAGASGEPAGASGEQPGHDDIVSDAYGERRDDNAADADDGLRDDSAAPVDNDNDAPDNADDGGGGGVQVQVVVSWATLAGLDDAPAEVPGLGPITAAAARELAGEGVWHRLVTDPVDGALVAMDSTAYRPPPRMAAAVRTRDRHCRWPGCWARAADCDLDHTEAAPCGPTCPANLHALCRRHHRVKTFTDTAVEADGRGGLTWTTPLGRRWRVPPDDPLAPDGGLPRTRLGPARARPRRVGRVRVPRRTSLLTRDPVQRSRLGKWRARTCGPA